MGITQDEPGVTNAKGARADLGDMNLNALFTGATCVRVGERTRGEPRGDEEG